MRTKTFTGPSIQAALKEARYALGDDVVLLESVPSQQGSPARIRVMVDTPLPDASSSGAEPQRSNGYAPRMRQQARSSAAEPAPATEGTAATARENVSEPPPVSSDRPQRRSALPTNTSVASNEHGAMQPMRQTGTSDDGTALTQPRAAGRNRLFSTEGRYGENAEDQQLATTSRPHQFTASTRSDDAPARLLESHLQMLHTRLENMERRFGGIIVGASHRWLTHPLYAQLLERGLRPSTITKLFDRLVERGFEPRKNDEELRWAMAQELRRMLSATAPKRANANYLFIGPSGAGKTSLLLKLARHDSFFGRRLVTVISITPEDDSIPHLSPVPLYRQYGLPVQHVQTENEMRQALGRVEQFDEVLVDTPPLPLEAEEARTALRRIHRIVNPLMPLQVHLTINVTRTLDDFDADFIKHLPLRPDAVALTHLDESSKWGRIAEWLLTLDKPVHFVSTGARVPDGVQAFTPSWFVEEMMQL